MTDALQRLGLVLRARREALPLNQEHFADAISMHRAYYGRIERGQANLTLETLSRVAEGLGVSCAELLREASI